MNLDGESIDSSVSANAGDALDIKSSGDKKPSGKAYSRPADLLFEINIIFSRMISACYAALSPSTVAAAGLGVLISSFLWSAVGMWVETDLVKQNGFEWNPNMGGETSAWVGAQSSVASPVKIALPLTLFPQTGGPWSVANYYLAPWRLMVASKGWSLFVVASACFATLLIWSWIATFICRVVGVKIVNANARFGDHRLYINRRFGDAFFSVAIPILTSAALALPIALVGALCAFDFAASVGSGLALVAGLFAIPMAIVLLGLLVSWPLMFPAIAFEGRDSFESISRGYAYVMQRPFELLFVTAVALFVGTVINWILLAVAANIENCFQWSISWGVNIFDAQRWAELNGAGLGNGTGQAGAAFTGNTFPGLLFAFFSRMIYFAVYCANVSVFWGLATASYLLMRRYLDQTPLGAIYFDGQTKLAELKAD